MNLDPIVEEEEEESIPPYSPVIVTPMAQQHDQTTLAHILRGMEIGKRETFDQLRADRGQSEIMMVKGEGGKGLMEEEGTTLSHKDNHVPSRYPSSKKRMTPTSTLNGRKTRSNIQHSCS